MGGVNGLDLRVQVRTCSSGVRPMAAGRGVMMDGSECVVCVLSLILGIGLLLLYARWLPSAVVKRVCLRNLPVNRTDLTAGRPMPRIIPNHC